MRTEQILQGAEVASVQPRHAYFAMKRAFDVVCACLLLLFASPLMLVVSMLVRLDSPGPSFFRQTRVGRNGRPFTFYKFRTMQHNADPEIHRRYVEALIRAETEQGSGKTLYKMARDPRITRVGRWLRRTSVDEVPQLFNVLKGDMSLVGPRPPLPYEVATYQDWHMGRLAVTPGLTGLWQVRGRSRVTFDEMVKMDLEYISNQSLWLDLKILVLTIPAVLSGTGAE